MTRREFNAKTQTNFGCRMASDERLAYRQLRSLDDTRAPLLERRAAYLAGRHESPLAVGSPMRVPALYAKGMWS